MARVLLGVTGGIAAYKACELAREQMQEADDFDYVVLNDDIERAVAELDGIVTKEAAGVGRLSAT